ncbi:MAG: A/G-specific adenine glycosylase [Phycisphaerae bacterium]|nr:A/G-specific adenine glycosylase [Phycisphaerae bacterium]
MRRALLAWFAANARDLPWRRTRDPYAIWISEIMLQQTRIDTVIPYYHRFLGTFPTISTLASADLDKLLKVWEGLGYYTRARNLHKAARAVVELYAAQIPDTFEGLLSLPGVGRYTAAAVASIAFGVPRAVLDGNVIRVLSRLDCVKDDPAKPKNRDKLWDRAEDLLDPAHPGDFNQAMMELGATICLPRNPLCLACPVAVHCLARLAGLQDKLPIRKKVPKLPLQVVAVGLIWKGRKLLIDKRKPEGLLGGLWEFPGGKRLRGEKLPATIVREAKEELDIVITPGPQLCVVEHAYSHFRVRLHVFDCHFVSGRVRCRGCDDFRWVRPQDLDRYAFPAANRKIFPFIPGADSATKSERD